MNRNIITMLAITALTTSTAYAGSSCGKDRSAYLYQPRIKPAIMTFEQTDKTAYRMQKVGYDSNYDGNLMYQIAAKNKWRADIVDTAIAAGSFNTLIQAMQAAGLVDRLKGDGPYTVFAPTDAAFAELPDGALENLLADKEKLTKVLTYHVVSGKFMASDLIGKKSINTVEGSVITSTSLEVSQADIIASNGVIHVIDKVLIP